MMNPRTARIDSAAATLWASAFILAALVIVQAGRLPGNPAYADQASNGPSFSLMTGDSGRGGDVDPDEVLYVIDNRAEVILCYGVEQGRVVLYDSGPLASLFRNALGR